MKKRGSGLLLHITSLPSPYGIGDLGPGAYRFVDFLSEAKQSFWQILPLNPTNPAYGNSPYSSPSAFAGNELLISPDLLVDHGYLSKLDIEDIPSFSDERVDYATVTDYKYGLLNKAFGNFNKENNSDFEKFCDENSYWLDDYALFISLKERFDEASWKEWPREIRDRKESAMKEWREKLKNRISMRKFFQYIFFRQFFALKEHCKGKNIEIIGDVPIYVSFDSVDVWANSEIFKLDENKNPAFVAGVPPDYFSKTGQRWGNPVYKWDIIKNDGYSWWIKRMQHNLRLFNTIRMDHFRGFVAYWEIPADEKTAINGKWVEAPAEDFFNTMVKHFSSFPVIAEDLGFIKPDVRQIMDQFGFPGMKLLVFSFGDDFPDGMYLPHNHVKNCVVYTGTHDNNTVKGWFREEVKPKNRMNLFNYIGREIGQDEIHWELIRLAMMSV
ncbi:MAG: 4-alpha-glucanotransferase, partial [Thermodesulfobacteriota bacterium]